MIKDKFTPFLDDRGSLIPIEFNSIPFKPERIFLVSNVPVDVIRGNHSHYITKQYLMCLDGQIEVILHDGINETKILLDKNEGVLVPELIWDSQKFLTSNALLLVFCSTNYNQDDYIFEFDKFVEIKKQFTITN
jgi:dTDP-4-dehydrorhamnose 3,5-epimerase-like enzyme